MVGVVRSPHTDVANTDGWGDVKARIELAADLGSEALTGLAGLLPRRGRVLVRDQVHRRASGLEVRGLDAVDGTPVLDLQPVMPRLLPDGVHEPGWSTELMARYYAG